MTSFESVSPNSFQLGDVRLDSRAHQIACRLNSSNLHLGFPGIFTQKCELKAFYRFVNNPRVSSSDIVKSNIPSLSTYFERNTTVGQSSTNIYCYQDTTFIDYTDRFHVKLGYTQNKTSRENSALLHSMIACNNLGYPIGLLYQDFFVRDTTENASENLVGKKEFEERESYKWVKGLEHVEALTDSTSVPLRPIVIGDREADSANVMMVHLQKGIDFIIRSKSVRNFEADIQESSSSISSGQKMKLHDWIQQGVGAQKGRQQRRLHARSVGKHYDVDCDIHYAKVTLKGLDQPVGIIYLREDVTTRSIEITDTEPAEWFLLTSLEINTLDDASRWLDAYTQRWPVTEDFHKVLKSGAKIEHRQLESKEALNRATALLSISCVQILSMRYLAEHKGDTAIKQSTWGQNPKLLKLIPLLDKEYLRKRDRDFSEDGSIKRLLQIIARMGGHQGYAGKGRPGWKTLWIGTLKLNAILESLDKYG